MSDRRVLILGADGFIGRHIVLALRASGHYVLGCARRTDWLRSVGIDSLAADLADPATHVPSFWAGKLRGITHIVNAAGLLDAPRATMHAVHVLAPAALYAACPRVSAGVLISAVGIDADTRFARARRQGEAAAADAPFPLTILRPGLVIASTSYGGTSLARALAAAPFRIPVVGKGTQMLNPVHAADLARVVQECLDIPSTAEPIEIGGPEALTQIDYLSSLRRWMGLPAARPLPLPVPLALGIGWLGKVMRLGPISRVSVRQLQHGVVAADAPMIQHRPAPFSETLASTPAGTQDLWHARLYLIRPLIRVALIVLWLASALLGLFLAPDSFLPALHSSGLPDAASLILARAGGVVDFCIAVALIVGWRLRTLAMIQIAVVLGYTVGLGLMAPTLWVDPFGGLLKNMPLLALLLVHRVLEQER